jgi:PKD repeat protein
MKKLLLTFTLVLTILFTQAQCQADFSYIQNGPTTVFTDLSTIQSGWSTNYSVSWLWDFGDNSAPSYQQNPTHTYSNGIYYPCLTVTFFDSTIMNSCTSIYCDSLLIGNAPPTSWDCNPVTGCYDPGTGNGQYTTLTACQNACGVIPSWDCNPNILGCYDPGTGLGQYTTLAACQSACAVTATWDCDPVTGCYDPGTGLGQYTSLSACQTVCSSVPSSPCDSMTAAGSQSQLTMQINNINIYVDYWVTTAPDMTILGEDSMAISHNVYNMNPITSQPYDTIITCLTYTMNSTNVMTCCVTWIWDGSFWAKIGSATSIEEINSTDKKLIKIVDILGRDTDYKSNELLFYIYDDGTIEKKYNIK